MGMRILANLLRILLNNARPVSKPTRCGHFRESPAVILPIALKFVPLVGEKA